MQAYLDGSKFTLAEWAPKEPPEVVVTLGHNPRTGGQAFFYEFIPCTKMRESDGRSIMVVEVDARCPRYLSPMSGGWAIRVKESEKTTSIQHPGSECPYPPNLKHSLRWSLFEVHIGDDPRYGPFIGVLMYRSLLDSKDPDFEYFQWESEPTCPPLYYGKFPPGWHYIDPEYVKLHDHTIELAQMATRYQQCEDSRCCVRFGCRLTRCCTTDQESDYPCHQEEKCANYNSRYDRLLKEWLEEQARAIDDLYAKIDQPLPALVDRVCTQAFGNFMMQHISQLPKKGPKRKKGMEFWLSWAKTKASGYSDIQFMDNWKVQHAKDTFLEEALEAAIKAEAKWKKILKSRKKK